MQGFCAYFFALRAFFKGAERDFLKILMKL